MKRLDGLAIVRRKLVVVTPTNRFVLAKYAGETTSGAIAAVRRCRDANGCSPARWAVAELAESQADGVPLRVKGFRKLG